MKFLSIDVPVRNLPELDPDFIPLYAFDQAYLKGARKPLSIAVERGGGEIASLDTFIYGTDDMYKTDCYYVDRLAKTLLWIRGGFRIYVSGDERMWRHLKELYSPGGVLDFDQDYMLNVFEHPFEVVYTEKVPEARSFPIAIGGHMDGCRIGFDAGGSDRKVSAVIDGKTVYSEEVVWYPKVTADPDYHYREIVSALRTAAEHMPRVDAVGISSAGVFINDRTMNSSLFLKVCPEDYNKKVKDIYIRAVRDTFGDIPFCVVNDGDVSALAGAMCLKKNNILGMAMGTSEAVGYVDAEGRITGWLNELAFVPVDGNPGAMRDEWSHDIGCGVKYFSQDGVIKLAPRAGIELDESLSPAEKLKVVQKLMADGDERAAAVYRSIGVYLAHSLIYYYSFYKYRHVLLLGRVMSGRGGELIISSCEAVIKDEYPEFADAFELNLPDEYFRRVGQSAVAASMPAIK
ncbi:MAG: ROK family protein [Candidatus Limivicinus sp.]|jgi:predicted NBD/HSP70 family sugar kinase